MEKRSSVFSTGALWVVAGCMLITAWLIALVTDPGRTWGIDGFRFLSATQRISLSVVAVLLAVGVTVAVLRLKERYTKWFAPGILAAFLLAMLFLPPATFLRGDGQLLIDAVRNHRLLPLRAPLTSLIAEGLSRVPYASLHAEWVFRIIGWIGGALHLWAAVLILRSIQRVEGKITAAMLLVFTGSLLLYSGLAEYYSLASGTAMLALALSLKPIREGKFPLAGFLVALLSTSAHVMGVVLLPAYLLALTPKVGIRWARLFFGVFALIGVVGSILVVRQHMMPPIGPSLLPSSLSAWGRKLLDTFNLLFWMAPGVAVLLPTWLIVSARKNSEPDSTSVTGFLFAAFLGSLGYLMLFKPDLGAARDADLYVLVGITLVLLFVELIRTFDRQTLAHAAGAILLAGLVTVGVQLIVQASENDSIARHRRLLELDPYANVGYGWEFLGQHYLETRQNREAFLAYTHAWEASHNPRYALSLSTLALEFHKLSEAVQWSRIAVEAFPDNPQAQASLGASLYASGNIRGSAEPLEKALRGGLADPTLVLLLGDAWVQTGKAAEAVDLLDRAFRSGLRANGNLITVMAQAQEMMGNPEIAVKLYAQALQLRPQEPFRSRANEGYGRLKTLMPESQAAPQQSR